MLNVHVGARNCATPDMHGPIGTVRAVIWVALRQRQDLQWRKSAAWVRNAFVPNYFDLLALQPGNTGLIVGQPGDPRTFGFTRAKSF